MSEERGLPGWRELDGRFVAVERDVRDLERDVRELERRTSQGEVKQALSEQTIQRLDKALEAISRDTRRLIWLILGVIILALMNLVMIAPG